MSNPYETADPGRQPLLQQKNSNPYVTTDYPEASDMHVPPNPQQYSIPTFNPAGGYYQPSPPNYPAGPYHSPPMAPMYSPPPTYAPQTYAPPPTYAPAYMQPAQNNPAPTYHKPSSVPTANTAAPSLKHSPVSAPDRNTLPAGVFHCPACGKHTAGIETKSFGCVAALWCCCLLPTGVLWLIPACSGSCKDTRKLCTECGTVLVETPASCC